MTLKKILKLIFLVLAICSVSAGCVYLVLQMNKYINDSRRYAGVGVVVAGAVCIVLSLINSIRETVEK